MAKIKRLWIDLTTFWFLSLRSLCPMLAAAYTRRGRTLTRQKPCSLRRETHASLRCTPASPAVRAARTHIHQQSPQTHDLVVSGLKLGPDGCVCVCVCVFTAGDKKMMVPSSTAGGQQLYSQTSPFQQGHSGKSFRYVLVMCENNVSLFQEETSAECLQDKISFPKKPAELRIGSRPKIFTINRLLVEEHKNK